MSQDKEIKSFKSDVWSNPQPLMFAISYVENLIKENYRMRSVMLKSLVEIDQNLKSHLSGDEKIDMELFRLLDNLCFRRRDEYNLDRDSFLKDIRAKLDFDNFEK